jgi:hypothetical protein
MLETVTPLDRLEAAAQAWGLARARRDERLRAAALADYRDALRHAHADRHRLDEIRHDLRTAARARLRCPFVGRTWQGQKCSCARVARHHGRHVDSLLDTLAL